MVVQNTFQSLNSIFNFKSVFSFSNNINFETTANPGMSVSGWSLTPDLKLSSNAISGELMMVEDGTAGTNGQGNPSVQII